VVVPGEGVVHVRLTRLRADSEGPVPLDLPAQWLWDIVDEFIYQFQSYSQWRNKVSNKTDDELLLLQDGGVWSSYSVLNVLYSLIQKSRITEQLQAIQRGEDPDEVAGEFGSRPLYKLLGYFSIIGLLRVHVLLGDYTLALKMLDHIELNKKSGLINRVTACHVTAYYYVGFAYLMLGRYPDAIRAFTHILVFIMRLRQYHTRSYQYDQINKTADRMYALLAICCALSPTRLDENIQTTMREKYGEQFNKMSRGAEGLAAFEELFLYACPKYITGNAPPYHDAEALQQYQDSPMPDPAQHQLKIFLADVRTQLSNANIRSFLRLYTSLGTDKLANFLEVDEEELIEELMVAKACSRSVKWSEGGLLEGEVVNTSDLDFVIDGVSTSWRAASRGVLISALCRTWCTLPSRAWAASSASGSCGKASA
jgi:translation initiation factor 3 subunit L